MTGGEIARIEKIEEKKQREKGFDPASIDS